jgi:MFS family permease
VRLSSAQLAPLRLSGFRNLFFAMLVSSAGTLLAAVALSIDVLQQTDSGPWVAAVVIVEYLPTVIVGLFLGPLLDRLDRRSLMIAADAVRAAVFAALVFAPNPGTIVALAAVAGLANGFFRPAVYAATPNLVPDADLPSANALLLTVENVSWFIGPLLGGVLATVNGPSTAYIVNSVSFVISIVFVVRIPARMLQSERALSRGHWRDLRDGFSAALRSPSMRTVLVAWSIASLATGAANAVEIFLAKHTFSAGNVEYALIFSAMGLGLILGTFYSAALLVRSGLARTYGASLTLMAMGYVGAAASPNIWVAIGCVLVAGLGNGAALACNALLVQRGTLDVMRGRALTFVMSITFVLVGVGNLAGGFLVAPTSPRWIWGACGVTLFIAAVAGWLLARKVRGETPVEADTQPEQAQPVAAAH